ncbi:MAG: hypothetical protein ACK56F_07280, partial [bacterium]
MLELDILRNVKSNQLHPSQRVLKRCLAKISDLVTLLIYFENSCRKKLVTFHDFQNKISKQGILDFTLTWVVHKTSS